MRINWITWTATLFLCASGFSAAATDIQPVVLTPTTNSAVVTFRVNGKNTSRSTFMIKTDLNTVFGKSAATTNLEIVILYLGSASFSANVSGTNITGPQISGKILRNRQRTLVLNAKGLDLVSLLNLDLQKAGNKIAPADVAITAVLPGSSEQTILFSAYSSNAGLLYHVQNGMATSSTTVSPIISATSSGISSSGVTSSGVITSSGITSSGITTSSGISTSGITTSGITTSGITTTSTSGITTSGITTSGITTTSTSGITSSGITTSGITTSGITTSGVTTSGITTSGVTTSGVTTSGITTSGVTTSGTTTTTGITTSGVTTTSGITTSGVTTSGVTTTSSSGVTTSGITTTTGITTTSGTTSSSGTTTSGTTTSGTTSSGFTQSFAGYTEHASS